MKLIQIIQDAIKGNGIALLTILTLREEYDIEFGDIRENIEDKNESSYGPDYWAQLEYLRSQGITTRGDIDNLYNNLK